METRHCSCSEVAIKRTTMTHLGESSPATLHAARRKVLEVLHQMAHTSSNQISGFLQNNENDGDD